MPGSAASAKLRSLREITRWTLGPTLGRAHARLLLPNCLATWPIESECCLEHEHPRQLAESWRARSHLDSSPHSSALRREETARARPRNGPGDQGVPKGKRRVHRRVAQGRPDRRGGEDKRAGIDCSASRRSYRRRGPTRPKPISEPRRQTRLALNLSLTSISSDATKGSRPPRPITTISRP